MISDCSSFCRNYPEIVGIESYTQDRIRIPGTDHDTCAQEVVQAFVRRVGEGGEGGTGRVHQANPPTEKKAT